MTGPRDPGRVTIRRLNRVEYDNTVRDLLGTTKTYGANLFPDDAPEVGFDNNGDLQTLPPVLFSLFQQAAEGLAAEAMTTGSSQRAKLVSCDLTQASCKNTIINSFGLRAFRRPLATAEVTSFTSLMATAAQAGATADEQFRTVIEAMLLSPHFLFRPELDADVTSLTPHLLNPYEAASRLSYMLYRSMPDQALFDAAAAGALAKPEDLQAQAKRMLADPKGVFGPTFSSLWLGTTQVSYQNFDAKLFPKFNPSLANSMGQELTAFFNDFLSQNGAVTDLLTAKFSYIDKNLASLYGIAAPTGTGLTRTVLTTPQRGGLLTMAATLSVRSYPTRTVLVKRGDWVLRQFLCAESPPPPDNVEPIDENKVATTTQKEALAQHRSNPTCAACHDSLDNVGIALENYDAIGAYRTTENGTPIDASGKFAGSLALPGGGTGPTFTGGQMLAATVASDPRFAPCMAKSMMSYALGRRVEATDPYLTDLTKVAQGSTLGVRDLVMNVVASEPFRMRHGDSTIAMGAKP